MFPFAHGCGEAVDNEHFTSSVLVHERFQTEPMQISIAVQRAIAP